MLKMNSELNRGRQSGLTLLEVMVAVIVFSVGLIGAGALLTSAIRGNHSALQRTTALTLASSMEARMARNSLATWLGLYNGTYSSGGSAQCDSQSCTEAQLAQADGALWGQQIADALPGGSGTIACINAAALPALAPGVRIKPPYSGTCQITISWTEKGDEGSSAAVSTQSFVHNVQP